MINHYMFLSNVSKNLNICLGSVQLVSLIYDYKYMFTKKKNLRGFRKISFKLWMIALDLQVFKYLSKFKHLPIVFIYNSNGCDSHK